MATESVEVPIAGKITSVAVVQGSKVKEGDVLFMLESMKMQNPISTPVDGVVKEIKVSPGQVVKSGTVLAVIEY